MPTLIHRRVEEARNGQNPKVICRTHTGWAVLGDVQFLRGYALLLPDPVVPTVNDLSPTQRTEFLHEMTLLGDAVLQVTSAKRINYSILGNLEPALHAHVFPRYGYEPEDLRTKPPWFYDWKNAEPFDADRDRELIQQIADRLKASGVAVDPDKSA